MFNLKLRTHHVFTCPAAGVVRALTLGLPEVSTQSQPKPQPHPQEATRKHKDTNSSKFAVLSPSCHLFNPAKQLLLLNDASLPSNCTIYYSVRV